ncbi:MAG: DoxX family membrane protein [Bacteroidales bacterium]|nr:DoxX family membrane protein [Bacteroidales bacterium]
MNLLGHIGRILYGIPFIVFGIFHFMNTSSMAESLLSGWPIPQVLVIITGIALVLAGVSIILKILTKWSTLLLGILLLIFVIGIHIPAVAGGGGQAAMSNLLKDLALTGAAWFATSYFAGQEQTNE